MFQHLVLIATSYKLGTRIGWHYSGKNISKEIFQDILAKRELLGKPKYSLHRLNTNYEDWESVIARDSFFEDIKLYKDLDEFFKVILDDANITALDIAKIVLSMSPMSNLKLQKIIYLIYANYLVKTGKKLFSESIKAYPYGPLIEEVYNTYKKHGRDTIKAIDDIIELHNITLPIIEAKLMNTQDSKHIIESIEEVMDKYGHLNASDLVDITHRKDSPWSHTLKYSIIQDEVITKYHCYEN